MNRSLQLQLLAWLAALAAIGAVEKPNLDTLLFAVAFVLGTGLMRAREHWKQDEERMRARDRLPGEAIATAIAWGAALLRSLAPEILHVPARLNAPTLALAAVIPSSLLLVRMYSALRTWRATKAFERQRERELDG